MTEAPALAARVRGPEEQGPAPAAQARERVGPLQEQELEPEESGARLVAPAV